MPHSIRKSKKDMTFFIYFVFDFQMLWNATLQQRERPRPPVETARSRSGGEAALPSDSTTSSGSSSRTPRDASPSCCRIRTDHVLSSQCQMCCSYGGCCLSRKGQRLFHSTRSSKTSVSTCKNYCWAFRMWGVSILCNYSKVSSIRGFRL